MLLFKENNNDNKNSLLSASKPNEQVLKTGYETKNVLKTGLKQKSIIKVYISDNKYFVEHSAAYALGLIKTRAIMMGNPKLVEISSEIHNKLKNNESIEIEYIKLENKQKLKVFVDNSKYCIDNSAAYSLGFMNVEEFNNSSSGYYYLSDDIINELKEKFDVEYCSLSLEQYQSNKKL